MTTLADRAEQFARQAQADRRVCDQGSDRQQHLARMTAILRHIGASDELMAAGYLYDLAGRNAVTRAEIEREFGPATAALVRSVASVRKTYAIGAGRLAFEDAEVQTLALAADLATLRGVDEIEPEARAPLLDTIGFRAARLSRAHLYLQYEVWQELARWRRRGPASRSGAL